MWKYDKILSNLNSKMLDKTSMKKHPELYKLRYNIHQVNLNIQTTLIVNINMENKTNYERMWLLNNNQT